MLLLIKIYAKKVILLICFQIRVSPVSVAEKNMDVSRKALCFEKGLKKTTLN